MRVEGNVAKFCSAFTHLKCHSVGSRPSNKPSTDAFSTIFNVINVVSNMSPSDINNYLENFIRHIKSATLE